MLGKCIYNILSNDANVSALVGTKIYPSMAIEDIAYPYIVYEQISNDPTNDKDGVSTLDVVNFDVEIFTKTPQTIATLSGYVRDALDRYSGTVEGEIIQSITFMSEGSGYSDTDRVFMKIFNINIRHQR